GVMGGGRERGGGGRVGGGNEEGNGVCVELRLLSSGIARRHGCRQAVVAQQADDQFRLDAAGNDRHGHTRGPAGSLRVLLVRAPAFHVYVPSSSAAVAGP